MYGAFLGAPCTARRTERRRAWRIAATMFCGSVLPEGGGAQEDHELSVELRIRALRHGGER